MSVDLEYDFETEHSRNIELIVPKLLNFFKEKNITATFFVLGKIAEQYHSMVKQIAKHHEIASHSYEHIPLSKLSFEEQEKQLIKGKEAIEKLGIQCLGIRAPYFMISKNHFELIKKIGFEYDSSISTFFPGRYHHILSKTKPYTKNNIFELPVPNWLPKSLPAGFSYYRLFSPLSKLFLIPYMIYLHPCEFMDAPMTESLPKIIQKAYSRNQGDKAWQMFTEFIEKNNDIKWVSCKGYIEKELDKK